MKYQLDTIKDVVTTNKIVIVRFDLNIPIKDGVIIDNSRILSTKKTLDYLVGNYSKVICISHLGRPNGEQNKKYSLKPVYDEMCRLFDYNIHFCEKNINDDIETDISNMEYGDIILLENIRFYKEEETNDKDFAKRISSLGNIYINDTFSCSHRAHASISGITEFMRSVAGFSLEDEVNNLSPVLSSNKQEIMTIIGGGKISTKINTVKNLIPKSKCMVILGAMSNTFLEKMGYNIGKSVYEKDLHGLIDEIMNLAKKSDCEVILPEDVVVAKEFKDGATVTTKLITELEPDDIIVDAGQKTIETISKKMDDMKLVLANGPAGAYEFKNFEKGSMSLMKIIAEKTKTNGLKSIAGGGDTVACINMAGVFRGFSFVSMAGGAFIDFISGEPMPGLESLAKAKKRVG